MFVKSLVRLRWQSKGSTFYCREAENASGLGGVLVNTDREEQAPVIGSLHLPKELFYRLNVAARGEHEFGPWGRGASLSSQSYIRDEFVAARNSSAMII